MLVCSMFTLRTLRLCVSLVLNWPECSRCLFYTLTNVFAKVISRQNIYQIRTKGK